MVAGKVGGNSLKPWELARESSSPKKRGSSTSTGPKQTEALTQSVVEEVDGIISSTNASAAEQDSVQFKAKDLATSLSRASSSSVVLKGTKLSIGAKSFELSAKQASAMTLLGPNQELVSGLFGGLGGGTATVVSAGEGAGAAYAARWLLDVLGAKHEVVRVSRTTSLDGLAGAMRPDETGALRVKDGPLASCIRNGGVFVADGIEHAEPDVLGVLKALAKGAKWFHHPVSGEPVPVHPDFRLVLIGTSAKKIPADLVGPRNLVHVPPYEEADHARLLSERHGLAAELAHSLAAVHSAIVKGNADGTIDFGRGFPLSWSLLDRVGARLSKVKGDVTAGHVFDAIDDLYGARLPDAGRAALESILEKFQLQRSQGKKPKASEDPTYVHTEAQDKTLIAATRSLSAGEVVLLSAPGQSGATRLVSELAARRGQPITTIVGHANTDPQLLMEMPVFDEKGRIFFKPGRIADALTTGKLLYVDHLDHMSADLQNAFFELARKKSISMVENGVPVEKPIHAKARIVLSVTEGARNQKSEPADRAQVTELRMAGPSVGDLAKLIPAEVKKDEKLTAVIEKLAKELDAEHPGLGVKKLQRFIDFARAAKLLTKELGEAEATLLAAKLVFRPPESSVAMAALKDPGAKDAPKADETPLYMRLLKLTPKKVEERLTPTGFKITPSMAQHLDALAVAYLLGRPVLAVGPASSGKTVIGAIWSALVEKTNVRVNFSASTEARELMGGLGPVNVDGKTVFKLVDGPVMRAADTQAVLTADEWNLSKEAQMSLKTWLDHRRVAADPESDRERTLSTAFLYATQNPTDKKTGRNEPPPAITDCMFTLFVDAKPIDERVDIVVSQCNLDKAQVRKIAELYEDLDILAKKSPFHSAVGPITTTERDMLKVARTVEYFTKRDGIKDPEERRKLLGRELFRAIGDVILEEPERKTLLDLIKKHLGDDIQPPARPTSIDTVTVGGQKFLQIGVARYPIRQGGKDPALDALIPNADGVRDPLGPQLELLESVLLAMETKQPVAVVGATGTGKTMLMRFLAHKLELPFREQAFHSEMTEDHLFGTTVIDEKGKIAFQYAPLVLSAKEGCFCVADEFLTLPNDTREKLNPFTEGSEIQISQKKPPETIKRKDWHEDFRFVITTNGDDIRDDGFSLAEASRIRLIGIRDLTDPKEYQTISLRDYAAKGVEPVPLVPKSERPTRREELGKELNKIFKGQGPIAKALKEAIEACAAGSTKSAELSEVPVPALALDDKSTRIVGEALRLFAELGAGKSVIEVLSHALGGLNDKDALALARMTPADALPQTVRDRAMKAGVIDGRLAFQQEAELGAKLFTELRALQVDSGDTGISPLTPRLFSSFMDLFVSLRQKASLPEAMSRAASLALWSKMGKRLEKKALEVLTATLSGAKEELGEAPVPRLAAEGTWFGDTLVSKGSAEPWKIDNRRFAMTPARTKNLSLLADAITMGKGRPISCTDDENGETIETLRELGRLTGRPVTVVSLPPNADIEGLIERLSLSTAKTGSDGSGGAPGVGFEPELQQIGQAVREGHILVLRGAGNVPTNALERLNSLGDGRMGIKLPRSGRWLKANDDFRMVLVRKPDAPHSYSAALQNRLIEPLLSTRQAADTKAALETRAAELAAVVSTKTGMSDQLSLRLAIFHTYLNQVLREGGFASGRAIGSLTSRDAEAVGHRVAWLKARGAVEDESETLHTIVMDVYGDRFGPETDRLLLAKLASKAFGAEGGKATLSTELSPSPHLVRLGEWAVARDPRGLREGVPTADAVVPLTATFADVEQKIFAALQFDEVVHLHGDEMVATNSVSGVARLTTSPVRDVEGNEELSEAYLFGGLIQNQQTGKLEKHEGLVWQAQREGGTLMIRNASRLPNDVVTRLVEVAATGHLSRVVDGKLEVRPRAFRLVLATNDGDPPLSPDLSQIATRIRCPEIAEKKELTKLVAHVLRGVPGGSELSDALVRFSDKAAKLIESESQTGRQPVRFDSTRLFASAREVARLFQEGVSLEDALGDVLSRLYLRPARGLGIDEKLGALTDELGASLDKVLVADALEPIDFAERPELVALEKDYRTAAPALTGGLALAARDALMVLTGEDAPKTKGHLAKVTDALSSIDSSVFPDGLRKRAAALKEKLLAGSAGPDDAGFDKLMNELGKLSEEGGFQEAGLELVRGARLWDLEHRIAILARYEDAFATLPSITAALRREDLQKIRARFGQGPSGVAAEEADKSALAKVRTMRSRVQKALDLYRSRTGETDEQLAQLFRRLIERWDLVATSPIFKAHHQLRNELIELSRLLDTIKEAHAQRGKAGAEATALFGALDDAGKVLEGLRIAEQSAELRQDLVRTVKSTENLVTSLRDEVREVRRLEEAKKSHSALTFIAERIAAVSGTDTFLNGQLASSVDRPPLKTKAELTALAAAEARELARPEVEAKRLELLATVQEKAGKKSVNLGSFFDGYDLETADAGLSLETGTAGVSASEKAYEEAEQAIVALEETAIQGKLPGLVAKLEAEDKARVEKLYKQRLEGRTQEVAARVTRSSAELARDLRQLSLALKLSESAPELAAEVDVAIAELDAAAKSARSWAQSFADWMTDATNAFLSMATFGFFGSTKPKAAPPEPDLSKSKNLAAAALTKLETHVKAGLAKLPSFAPIGDHRKATDELASRLVSAENLGDLATRYAKLAALADNEDNAEVKRYLRGVLGQLANSADLEETLLGVSAFSESADLLSSEVAKEVGVGLEIAPVLEAVMRSAEIVRAAPITGATQKQAIKALASAISKIDGLGLGDKLPALLGAVRTEMEELSAKLAKLSGEDGSKLKLETGAAAKMLEELGARAKAAEETEAAEGLEKNVLVRAEREATTDLGATKARSLETWIERAAERSSGPTDPLELVTRSTDLKIIELDFDRVVEIDTKKVSEDSDEEPSKELVAARKDVRKLGEGLSDVVTKSLEGVRESSDQLRGALETLEGRLRDGVLARRVKDLSQCTEDLEHLLSFGGAAFRGVRADVGNALYAMREVEKTLRANESVPPALGAKLSASVSGARSLAAAFASDRFHELAYSWASDALVVVSEVKAALGELLAEPAGGKASKKSTPTLLSEIGSALETIGNGEDLVGAWSRLSLLAHGRARLSGLADTLSPGDAQTAKGIVTSVEGAVAKLDRLSGGPAAEQTLSDLHAGFLDLGDALAGAKKLAKAQVERFEELTESFEAIFGKAGGEAALFDHCEKALELLGDLDEPSSVRKAGKELSLSISELRRAFLDRKLARAEDRLRLEGTTYLGDVRDARLRLIEARDRFLSYDPVKEKLSLAELAKDLRAATTDASQKMTGPAATLLAEELQKLSEGLTARAADSGTFGAEAKALKAELLPLEKGLEQLMAVSAAPERLSKLMSRARERIDRARKDHLSRDFVSWAEGAVEAIVALTKVSRNELAAKLAEVEKSHFPELVEAKSKAATEIKRVVVGSRVEELLGGGGRGGVGIDVAGARDGLAVLGGRSNEPGRIDGELEEGGVQGTGKALKGLKAPNRNDVLDVKRPDLADGKVTERADHMTRVELSTEGLTGIRKDLEKAIAEARAAELEGGVDKPKNDFEKFVDDHADLVDQMATTLRKFPNTEIAFVIDQSGSTSDKYGDSRIIDQERAALAVMMAATMRGESNCSVVGFGGPSSGITKAAYSAGGFQIFVHKPMAERLDNDVANVVYGVTGVPDGGTDFIGPMQVALGQFTKKSNNKLVFLLTDAYIDNPTNVRHYIDTLRAQGVGVCVQGFGSAQNTQAVAGEFGAHSNSFAGAVKTAGELLQKTIVANEGKFQGTVDATVQGVGVTDNQLPIISAESPGPMASSLEISQPVPGMSDPSMVLGTAGPRRALQNLVDRGKYDRALKSLEKVQDGVEHTKAFKQALREVRGLRDRHEREGIIESLREAMAESLPRSRSTEWERKQLSGPLFDEEQLPMYVVGLEQGVPVMRLFKRKRPKEETRARVVLQIDESSSMGDTAKMRANVEALIATADALKALDKDVELAVIGFSDKVRLHHGFEQDWTDEAKAHLLHQVSASHDATDDERGATEAVGLLNMTAADVGLVIGFSDGQGMPATQAVMEQAAKDGYAMLTVGVTPECKAVQRFGQHGLYARNLSQLAQKLPGAMVKLWEKAGRVSG